MTPQPTKTSKLEEILQAILAGLQIAAEALPVIGAYQTQFGGSAQHLVAPIAAEAAQAHPATGAVVSIMLSAPPAPAVVPAAPAPAGN